MAKRKFVLSIELIGLILVIALALIGFYINSNDKEVTLLNNEIGRLKEENEQLKAESDPNWHSKFNNQRQFYEAELSTKDKELLVLKVETDSLVKIKNFLKHKDLRDLIYTLQVVDSLIKGYEKEIEIKEQIISSQDNLIRLDSSMNQNLKLQAQALTDAYDNSQKIIAIYSRYELGNKVILGLNVLLFIVIILYFYGKRRDLNKSKSVS